MSIHPMSAVDAAWYHMDGPANRAVVTGIVLTKEPLDYRKVKAVYRHRLAAFDRFRQRVVERGRALPSPQWEDMPAFDIEPHFHHQVLPAPHDMSALTALVSRIASAPFDPQLPLWDVHVVDRVDGGSALIMRYHHCIGDGSAMMVVIQRLFDTVADTPLKGMPASTASTRTGKAGRSAQRQPLSPALGTIERAARRALETAGAAVDALAHPQPLIEKAGLVLAGAGMLVAELIKWPDPKSPLKGEFRPQKSVAWSKPVAIGDVKAIGAPLGAKVNDVLVAAMTGALRAYLKRRGVDVNHTTVRAMVPVDLRPPERFGELGNEFGLVILDLAVAQASPLTRLATTKARMDALKRTPEAVAMRVLLDIFGRGPKQIEDLANQVFGSKASVVMTNVAGPRQTLYLAGTPIDRLMFWVPHPGRQLGMGISILSYQGFASLAVIADAHLVPDPEAITDQFNREFDGLLRRSASPARSAPAKSAPSRAPRATQRRAEPRRAGTRRAGTRSSGPQQAKPRRRAA